MKSTNIENIKSFTSHLFAKETFDRFLVTEASFSTLLDVSFDGHINRGFLSEEDLEQEDYREGIVLWKKMRPLCYEVIKGKRVPLRFKIVFQMPSSFTERFLSSTGLNLRADQVNGLFLNVSFQDGKLLCTTGTSLKEFSLDKSLEHAWDEQAVKFLNRIQ